jgi:hypothetical protein
LPSAYEPSVYEPSAYEPSAYEPSAYEPSAYEPSAYEGKRLVTLTSSVNAKNLFSSSLMPGAMGLTNCPLQVFSAQTNICQFDQKQNHS